MIGNPPWDRMKMQEVEWFAGRAPEIAHQTRAADRKASVEKLLKSDDPLARQYERARDVAETAMRVARQSGVYPLLSRGDINLYSLFVERAQALISPTGAAGLLTPSGIASDLTASEFFKSVSTSGRVLALFDFENGRMVSGPAFPDVHRSFKFCACIIGGASRTTRATVCGFFLHDAPAAGDPHIFSMTAADFARVNPNTGTAPIFRTGRDARITRAIYSRLPVLVDRSSGREVRAWPVRYATMFHMTNDSHLFWTEQRLKDHGAYRIAGGRWAKGEAEWVPLYEGKMVQAFDHRAAKVVVNTNNVHRPAQSEDATFAEHADHSWAPTPQFWVAFTALPAKRPGGWVFGFKEITASTNQRTFISALFPAVAFGNKVPLLLPDNDSDRFEWLLVGDTNSFVFDYVTRQKVHGQTLNWYLVEQLPVLDRGAYDRKFGAETAQNLARRHILQLSYTSLDLSEFARQLGHVDAEGQVLPPFAWDEDNRRLLRARLDALYFLLYGVTDRDDVRHILSTFPIVERKDRDEHGCYLTQELILWFMNALEAGDTERDPPVADLIRAAV